MPRSGAPKRLSGTRGRRGRLGKGRPRTPVVAIQTAAGKPSGRAFFGKLRSAGAAFLRLWVPARWGRGRGDAAAPTSSDVTNTVRRPPTPFVVVPRPTFVAVEREAAAVRSGLDLSTFNMLMDLQHRDITPEDYDTLRRLDLAVQPRTLTLDQLDAIAPASTWDLSTSPIAPAANAPAAESVTDAQSDDIRGSGDAARGAHGSNARDHSTRFCCGRIATRRNRPRPRVEGSPPRSVTTRSVTAAVRSPALTAAQSAAARPRSPSPRLDAACMVMPRGDASAEVGDGVAARGSKGLEEASAMACTCCICLEPLTAGECVRRLPCRHIFHAACIDEWLTTSSDICPECNQIVE